jgi:hypothetical protein
MKFCKTSGNSLVGNGEFSAYIDITKFSTGFIQLCQCDVESVDWGCIVTVSELNLQHPSSESTVKYWMNCTS